MPHSDTTEKGLETIMVEYLRDHHGYEQGVSEDYNKDYALDDKRVERFVTDTQRGKVAASMCFATPSERHKFFTRLRDEIGRRGVTDVLRKGYRFNGSLFDLYYPIPSELNPDAQQKYDKNIFCVIRQMHHSIFNADDAVDVCISINGLPVATFELKNHYTGQTVQNAVKQYKQDRSPKDPIFAFKRCSVHFAVDDDDIMMCTRLEGQSSFFLPFNKGVNGGAGNPVNPNGVRTSYLWEDILSKLSLSDIIENYAQVTVKKDPKAGKKIIITTVHKFQFILEAIGSSLKDSHFAIIIDEAHSSQSGSMSADMNIAISGKGEDEQETIEDRILKIIEGRKMAPNANYYAFTATPKNKTLEMFGSAVPGPDGQVQHVPFHEYTMKQAIEEGFILDVLKYYTPYRSYYKVMKAIQDDPEFDKKQASQKIRAFVERQPETIDQKSRIIVEHFLAKVVGGGKIGGQARAMVVTSSIVRAIEFYYAISKRLEELHSRFKPIIAFSGEKEYGGKMVSEATINGFPSSEIETRIENDPYRILVVADKFQTGYDQPLLHTMYVDKQLSDVKAVQTLSRLNRSHPQKKDTFVLDFANETETIQEAFQKYYKTTVLTCETDPNKLNDLIAEIESCNIYTEVDVDKFNELYWSGTTREALDPIINLCVDRFKNELHEPQQISCKSAIKGYVRIYPFLSAVMPFKSVEWEKLYHFYYFLGMKLPKLKIDDWTEGLIDAIDFDKYRIIDQGERQVVLEDAYAEIDPVPVGKGGGKIEPDMDTLSNIIEEFNTLYGGIEWEHATILTTRSSAPS